MRFVQFTYKKNPYDIRVGYLVGNCVVDIHAREKSIPKTMFDFLQNDYFLKRIEELKDRVPMCSTALSDVVLKAPITGMDKLLCVGPNYRDYCDTYKVTRPPVPLTFSKFSSTITGPSDPLKIRTDITEKVDWGVGLCLVIGKMATFVQANDAYKYIFGCTIAQDISARDWLREKNLGQFLIGKSMDTFCPLGPCIVTLDEIGDPENLEITCKLNGVYKQRSRTDQLIHNIPTIIERLTSVMTLLPGDLILTGTPVGVGMFANPPEFLRPGDVLNAEIEKIGVLETRVEKYIKPEDEYVPLIRDLISVKC